MSIQTKILKTSPRELFTVFMRYYLERRWWVGLVFVVLIAINIRNIAQGSLDYMPISALVIILLLVFYVNWRKFYSSRQKQKYSSQSFLIDQQQIIIQYSEHSNRNIAIQNLKIVVEKPQYFLLFYSKNDFIYFPHRIFQQSKDIELFKEYLSKYNERIKR